MKKTLADMQGQTTSFANATMRYGAVLSAAGAAISAPLTRGVNSLSAAGAELHAANRRTAAGVEQLGSLSFATGASADAVASGMSSITGVMQGAMEGSIDASRTLALLGVTLEELQPLTESERLRRFADGLQRIGNVAQRAQLQSQLGLGGLNLEGGSAGVAQREQRGRDLGIVLSSADVATAREFNRAQTDLQAVVASVWNSIGASAMPVATSFIQILTDGTRNVRAFIDENRGAVQIATIVAAALVGIGLGLGLVSATSYLAAGGIGVLTTVMGVVPFMIGLITGAIGVLGSIGSVAFTVVSGAASLFTGALTLTAIAEALASSGATLLAGTLAILGSVLAVLVGSLIVFAGGWMLFAAIPALIGSRLDNLIGSLSQVGNLMTGLVGTARAAWAGIQDAMAGGDMTLVWQIIVAAADLAWEQVKGFAIGAWIEMKYAGFEAWNSIGDFLSDVFTSAWIAIRLGWADVLDFYETHSFASMAGIAAAWQVSWLNAGWNVASGLITAWGRVNQFIFQSISRIAGSLAGTLGANVAGLLGIGGGPGFEDDSAAAAAAASANVVGGAGPASGGPRRAAIEEEARLAREQEAQRRQLRDAELEASRLAEGSAARDSADAAVNAAQSRLDALNLEAWIAAEQRRIQGSGSPLESVPNTVAAMREQATAVGTFSAEAVRGMDSGPMDRVAANTARSAELLAATLEVLRATPLLTMG